MRWHLVAPDGSIARSADAGSLPEARFRLAPLEGSVISDAAYRTLGITRDESQPIRQRIATAGKRRRDRNKAARQARWRAKKLQQDANWERNRSYAHRVAQGQRLGEAAGEIVGLMIEGVDERTIAKRFGVSAQSVNNVRRAYRVPTMRTIRRKQVEVLARYYAAQGYPLYEVAERCKASRKMVRSILGGTA